ncbi:hypothetical protein D3C79_888800 [compost metagenome]
MPGGKAAGGQHRAAETYGGDTQGVTHEAFHFLEVGFRPGQFWHAGWHRAENRYAEAVQAEHADHQCRQHHCHQRGG